MIGAPGETDITRAKTAYMKELVGGFPVTWLYEDLFGCVQKTIRCSEKDTPLVYHVLRETGGPYQATNQLCTDPSIITLMPNDGSVFLAFQINETTCSGHVFVLPKYRGSRAEQAEREAIRWVINNTQYKTVLGFTKQKDRHIIDFHKRVGMKEVCAIDDQVIFAWENK